MSRKLLVIAGAIAIGVFLYCQYKRDVTRVASRERRLKTAKYEAEARRQINKENMVEELEKIEKAIEREIREEE